MWFSLNILEEKIIFLKLFLREKEVDSSFNQKEDCFVVLNKKEKKQEQKE